MCPVVRLFFSPGHQTVQKPHRPYGPSHRAAGGAGDGPVSGERVELQELSTPGEKIDERKRVK